MPIIHSENSFECLHLIDLFAFRLIVGDLVAYPPSKNEILVYKFIDDPFQLYFYLLYYELEILLVLLLLYV